MNQDRNGGAHSWRRGRRILWLAVLASCTGETEPTRPGAAKIAAAAVPTTPASLALDAPLVLGPGDCLLDHLDHVDVEAFSPSNLPDELRARLHEPLRLRSAVLAPGEWVHSGLPPPELRDALQGHPGVRYWKSTPRLRPLPGGWPVRVYVNDTLQARWKPEQEPFPGQAVWWDRRRRTLFALSVEPPQGVRVQARVDPSQSLGRHEAEFLFAPDPVVLEHLPGERLLGRLEIHKVSRPVLAAPAPTRLSWSVQRLQARRLEIAFAALDHSFVWKQEHAEPEPGRSDGVTFAVEVEHDGVSRRVFERHVARAQVGGPYQEAVVDLAAFEGQDVILRLITEPGPAGHAWFDYAVWSGLRLRGAAGQAPARPHIVLVDIDTLRGDRLGCYGYDRHPTSPRIDAWAERSAAVYTNSVASATWTLPSTASILTGLAVNQHQVRQFPDAIQAETEPLAMTLRAAGYETRAIAEGGYVRPVFGFDQGFDVYDCTRLKDPDWSEALEALGRRDSERPMFWFLHTYLVHAPYEYDPRFEDPDAPYDGWLAGQAVDYDNVIEPWLAGTLELSDADRQYVERLYDALVRRMDDAVGAFLEELDRVLAGQPYLVLLTSDHGEEFFEHGGLGHGQSLYQELLAVPLLVRAPGLAPGRRTEPVSTLDIVPTLLQAAGLEVPAHLPGRSLLQPLDESNVRVAHLTGVGPGECVVYDGFKLIVRSGGEYGPELYALPADPAEAHNLFEAERTKVEALGRRLEDFLQRHPPLVPDGAANEPAGADALDDLRALGYLGDR